MFTGCIYIEAYRQDGSEILGNLDGQTVIRGRFYRRSKAYKSLRYGIDRPRYDRVSVWRVVDEYGNVLETFPNHLKSWEN